MNSYPAGSTNVLHDDSEQMKTFPNKLQQFRFSLIYKSLSVNRQSINETKCHNLGTRQ